MSKLTDNKIIMHLEALVEMDKYSRLNFPHECLSLINRQKAEIEKLNGEIRGYKIAKEWDAADIARQKAEIERLESSLNVMIEANNFNKTEIERLQMQIVRNRLQSIPLPMPLAPWLREELTEYCNNRCMEEL